MALGNAIYPLWKEALMQQLPVDKSLDQGSVNALDGVYVALVDTDTYIYSAGHKFYSDVTTGAAVQGTPSFITNATVVGRVFAGDTVVYTNVTGTKIGGLVAFRKNKINPTTPGPASSWRLVLYEDTGIVGLPMIPSGGNIIVSWNVQGIFGL